MAPPRSSARLQARRLPGAGLDIDTGNDIRGNGTTTSTSTSQDSNSPGSTWGRTHGSLAFPMRRQNQSRSNGMTFLSHCRCGDARGPRYAGQNFVRKARHNHWRSLGRRHAHLSTSWQTERELSMRDKAKQERGLCMKERAKHEREG